jgi:UDP-glucuronate 4-epimerase
MAYFKFAKAILEGTPIDVYNNGKMKRDFTYIDDVVEGILKVLDKPAEPDPTWSGKDPKPNTSQAPYRIYNIGNSRPVNLMDFIEAIEETLGKKAEKNFLPMQEGDVPATWAMCEDLQKLCGYHPGTPIANGVSRFIAWYKEYSKKQERH